MAKELPRHISRSAFAKMVGVVGSTISLNATRGTIGCRADGWVDLEDRQTQAYIRKREQKLGKSILSGEIKPKKEERPKSAKIKAGKVPIDLEHVNDCLDPSVEVDVESFVEAEKDSPANLETLKRIVDIRHKEADTRVRLLKLAVHRDELVDRRSVGMVAFSHLDGLSKRILDLPLQIVDQVIAMVSRSGQEARQDVIDLLNSEHAKALRATKTELQRVLAPRDLNVKEGEVVLNV